MHVQLQTIFPFSYALFFIIFAVFIRVFILVKYDVDALLRGFIQKRRVGLFLFLSWWPELHAILPSIQLCEAAQHVPAPAHIKRERVIRLPDIRYNAQPFSYGYFNIYSLYC